MHRGVSDEPDRCLWRQCRLWLCEPQTDADGKVASRWRRWTLRRSTKQIRFLAIAVLLVVVASRQADAEPKREVPDYDGRGNEDAKPDSAPGSWALWIPRVVLWPVYALNEYAFRRPIAAV